MPQEEGWKLRKKPGAGKVAPAVHDEMQSESIVMVLRRLFNPFGHVAVTSAGPKFIRQPLRCRHQVYIALQKHRHV